MLIKIEDIEKTIKPKRIPVRNVEAWEDIQPRLRLNHEAVRRYKDRLKSDKPGQQHDEPEPFPPILVMDMGPAKEGARFVVIDGHHRLLAHRETHKTHIQARVIKTDLNTAKLLAAQANLLHGVPLSSNDHREVFRRYVQAGANVKEDGDLKSYREIRADLLAIRVPATLMNWMKRDFPEIAAEMAKREDIDPPTPYEDKSRGKPYLIQELEDCIKDLTRLGMKASKGAHKEDFARSLVNTVIFLSPYYGSSGRDPEAVFKGMLKLAEEEDLEL
jgi:hypothetical protein